MTDPTLPQIPSVMILDRKTAGELMTPHIRAVRADSTVEHAIAFLMDNGLHAVPVFDSEDIPVGVLSRSDIVAHDRQRIHPRQCAEVADGPAENHPASSAASTIRASATTGARLVREIMSPVIYAVKPEMSAKTVVQHMLLMGVHRLFVTALDGTLLGVISSLDVLRHLHEPMLLAFDQVEVLCADDAEYSQARHALGESS